MAPRKDMMRVIRRDAGFSATLGFGESAGDPKEDRSPASNARDLETSALATGVEAGKETGFGVMASAAIEERAAATEAAANHEAETPDTPQGVVKTTVVYVAVSLTAAQAPRVEAWAKAARCPVPFLIRRVAQGLRDDLCRDWKDTGWPEVCERRGARGRHPTSVTLTLPETFVAELSARHDPLGIIGLGRAMGPAFRARFEVAFDAALAESGF
ncbi:hypothetical protein LPB142_17835 (plasmid) [Rhodobacter xanthinilyticus]|uniref:Uncharacterized protein n=1 Tax=Rhodobacter xanthinilyticus TaxID=1850250 RepID=A0A1D9MHP1_9RHOB|nr:hypothetical protein [Rhodobacter xanthinilyticus]AOZ71313.1 hypothetical protein LPB142_17835 [Rhodobacter xanthinilyticus]